MITISERVYRAMAELGAACYPDEACGVLLGNFEGADAGLESDRTVTRLLAVRNEAGEKFHRFLITPEEMVKAEMTAREEHLEVVGIFHTHPDVASVPSGYDRDHALPVYSYIIGSVQKGVMQRPQSWVLHPEDLRFYEEKLVVAEEEL